MNDTKLKGNLTEMQCMLAFMKLGYQISIPFGEDCRYDFIADINNKLYRIQCKTSSEFTDASGEIAGITFKTCRQTGSNARTSIRTKYTKDDIEDKIALREKLALRDGRRMNMRICMS